MSTPDHIEAVRHFSRFYTRKLGVLRERLLDGPYSLAEARVIYELAHQAPATAAELAKELGLDASYLSRIVKALEQRGAIERQPSTKDGRENVISLTKKGRQGFALINTRSQSQVKALLDAIPESERRRLVHAMGEVQQILGDEITSQTPYILRPHQPGDIGWVIHRHGVLYVQEYGWDESFEALVAQIAGDFIRNFDPKWERCWIAEKDGENVGSVFVVRKSETVAKLRLLLVEPKARGLGIGRRLVTECIRFAKLKGYHTLTLWTNDVLVEARHIYEQAGFELVDEELHTSFGRELTGQNWNLRL